MASDAQHKIHHYVLVHGACHGAWSWYKLKPLLQSAGHRVSVLDLAASGIHPAKIQDLRGAADYSGPLLQFLASLPSGEKVVLVGHSLGGINLALAADRFPNKIAVAVFLAAFLPDTDHKPSYVIEQDVELAKALIRPGSLFIEDLSKSNLSKEGYESVPRAYIVCEEDMAITQELQQWMIQNAGVNDVLEIKGADHMAMLSKPRQLCDALLQIASKYT